MPRMADPSRAIAKLQKRKVDQARVRTYEWVVKGAPMGKPRMTRRDKWLTGDRARRCVAFYRAWRDNALLAAPKPLPTRPLIMAATAYFPLLKEWNEMQRTEMMGKPYLEKPDFDNIAKSIADLFPEDKSFYQGTVTEFWDDGQGPRVEIKVLGIP